jgi:hypothetical protein
MSLSAQHTIDPARGLKPTKYRMSTQSCKQKEKLKNKAHPNVERRNGIVWVESCKDYS